eukprot:jgi/Picre1/35557/NNA_003018.t1
MGKRMLQDGLAGQRERKRTRETAFTTHQSNLMGTPIRPDDGCLGGRPMMGTPYGCLDRPMMSTPLPAPERMTDLYISLPFTSVNRDEGEELNHGDNRANAGQSTGAGEGDLTFETSRRGRIYESQETLDCLKAAIIKNAKEHHEKHKAKAPPSCESLLDAVRPDKVAEVVIQDVLTINEVFSDLLSVPENMEDVFPERVDEVQRTLEFSLHDDEFAIPSEDWHEPFPSAYENVRVEDVENDILQAGLLAAEAKNYEAAEHGQDKLALEDYNHAVALAPEAAVPLLNRGLAYEQLGVQYEASNNMSKANDAWEQGRLDLKTAIQLDPQEFAAYYDLGLIEMRLQRYDDASVHLQQAADLAPGIAGYRYGNYAEAHAALASFLKSQGKFGQAEEEIAKAVELDPLWADPVEVKKNTRWPPKLYAAHEQLIKIS